MSKTNQLHELDTLAASWEATTHEVTITEQRTKKRDELRLFSMSEITESIIKIAPGHLRRVLKENPDLPQGYTKVPNGMRWFSFSEIQTLRQYFHNTGAKHKKYYPYRPNGTPPKVVTILNYSKHNGKTITATNLATAATIDGYKVLLMDLDPQCDLTNIFGIGNTDKWATSYSILPKNFAHFLKHENIKRMSRGEPPIPMNPDVAESNKHDVHSSINKTKWMNLDIIPSSFESFSCDLRFAREVGSFPNWKYWKSIKDILNDPQIDEDYDIIIIDTSSNATHIAISAAIAADIILIPCKMTMNSISKTTKFLSLLNSTIEEINRVEYTEATAIGESYQDIRWDSINFCPLSNTFEHVNNNRWEREFRIKFNDFTYNTSQFYSPLLDQLHGGIANVYEIDYRNVDRREYQRTRQNFDVLYDEFKKTLERAWSNNIPT